MTEGERPKQAASGSYIAQAEGGATAIAFGQPGSDQAVPESRRQNMR